jgi:hypothetical protein
MAPTVIMAKQGDLLVEYDMASASPIGGPLRPARLPLKPPRQLQPFPTPAARCRCSCWGRGARAALLGPGPGPALPGS